MKFWLGIVYEALTVHFLAIHHAALETLLDEQANYDLLVVLDRNSDITDSHNFGSFE